MDTPPWITTSSNLFTQQKLFNTTLSEAALLVASTT